MTPEQARELLDSETFQMAVQELREQLRDEWAHSVTDETVRREACYLQLKAIDLVLMRLEIAANGGAVLRARADARRLMS